MTKVAELFEGPGEMRALMRAMDWSRTKLGPVDRWPSSLRTMVGFMLSSRFPLLLWWGPEMLQVYNDAFRPILRDKHPALGRPASEVWPEVWDFAGPIAHGVLAGGPATWNEDVQLFINAGGIAEETYFTFSYTPAPDDEGGVGGVLNIVQETTAKVHAERQIRTLHELSTHAVGARSEDEAARLVVDGLAKNALDLPFVLLFRVDDAGGAPTLLASAGLGDAGDAAAPEAWPLAAASAHEVVIDDLASRFPSLPAGPSGARPERALAMPLSRPGQARAHAVLVVGSSPHRALDERYRPLFVEVAERVTALLATARAYEDETRRAEALAELDRGKTAFFGNVSHELRTPLTLILGPLEDALARPERALRGEDLEAAHRSALRLLRLVNSLLDFARLEAGRLEVSFAPTDLAALTTDLASSFRSLIERASIALVVDCPPLRAPVYVDAAQWEKIVLNLLSNAFKFTFEGEIAVSLREQGERVTLAVRDTGTGIPAAELPRLFERFHRVEGAPGRSVEGTGIGLSLVKELVELHGGRVRVESVVGRGTTFEVELPTGAAHLPAARVVTEASRATAPGTSPLLLEAERWTGDAPERPPTDEGAPAVGVGAERATILVADDNTDMRQYLTRLLTPRWRVEAVSDGEAALERARTLAPDLVLSDVMMPRLDGVALLRELRADARTREIPVVLLSARAGEEALLEGFSKMADDYLVKPFAARELVARVQTHLEMARLRRRWSRELARANQELEAFSYSVSHDLRAPLRAIDGFSAALLQEHGAGLSLPARHHLDRVRAAAQRMGTLIDDLLGLARITKVGLRRAPVDLTALARKVLAEIEAREPAREVEWQVADGLHTVADARLVTVVLENLLGNAWKFTGKKPHARIEVGSEPDREGAAAFFVRDNGAGFDMKYVDKLFAPFQRLHAQRDFDGTGIGLATVQRIVARHDGRVWANGAEGEGATFYFTLDGEGGEVADG
ncbi:MAG TPA: ATP-binding protein [Polyangia bacterium]|nr:ATP-binding protein [Polyangia bacterium]